jgi:DNA-directed RNA polymerase subunit RPC12/RpoP
MPAPFIYNLHHKWCFDLELSNASAQGKQCYRCASCGQWTEGLTDLVVICPKADRRRMVRRKFADRRNAAHKDEMVQLQASALMDIPMVRECV